MKRALTPEQETARDERRVRFREIVKRVGAMSPVEREALAARVSGLATCERHSLSFHNVCMILHQCNGMTPSIVGGFKQWKRHGRCVRKGESGLMIWFPSVKKNGSEGNHEDSDGEPDELRFYCGYVFDISQTEEVSA